MASLTYVGQITDPAGIHAKMVGQAYYHFMPVCDEVDEDHVDQLVRTGLYKRTPVATPKADKPAK